MGVFGDEEGRGEVVGFKWGLWSWEAGVLGGEEEGRD